MGYIRSNLVGQKFGHLQVIESAGLWKNQWSAWKVRCDCGKEKIVVGYGLTRKTSPYRSCGCQVKQRCSILGKQMWRKNSLGISESATFFLDRLEAIFKIPIQREFEVSSYLYDGRIENILIEVDGAYWHRTPYQKIRDIEKTRSAVQNGFKLYRFDLRRKNDVQKALEKYAATIADIAQIICSS